MTLPIRRRFPLILCAIWFVVGCGPDGSRGGVSGAVTVDGKPLAAGFLQFRPAEGTQGPIAGATISDGRYTIPRAKGPMAGTYLVEVHAVRKSGKKVFLMGNMVDEEVEALPARYNTQSTLRQEVKASNNTINLVLTSN